MSKTKVQINLDEEPFGAKLACFPGTRDILNVTLRGRQVSLSG